MFVVNVNLVELIVSRVIEKKNVVKSSISAP